MSIWGKIIGGVTGFAVGGPLGAIVGAAFGHAIDSRRSTKHFDQKSDKLQTRQTAFTVAVIVLSAKMAKADGQVTRDEINVFKRIFEIPENEISNVGKLFNEARQDAEGYEPYANQIGEMFIHDQAVRENLLGGLFQIAVADGVMHSKELKFLQNVASSFRLNPSDFERIRSAYTGDNKIDPYQVLGVDRNSSNNKIKKHYRELSRENHPDTLIASGMPQEFIDIANEKMANINAAYDKISKERSL
ncbi:MAG: TerB family tellurite resistance protein [Pseudomonadota bacterium]|nr:TerB family tellurite resistance protein [Pseudomonadota bacterium]